MGYKWLFLSYQIIKKQVIIRKIHSMMIGERDFFRTFAPIIE